jgi:SAM-dependent methyltransferase
MNTPIEFVHQRFVHNRRVDVLCRQIEPLMPANAIVLDVGCGDGLLDRLLMERRPDLSIEGVDVLVREDAHIPVREFHGKVLPWPDNSVDVVLFVDVLHHTDDPTILLREAHRVSRQCVIIKDHLNDGFLSYKTLSFMDNIGNKRHGVVIPNNYWKKIQWNNTFNSLGLKIVDWETRLGLYPFPANLVFERGLHFVARMDKESNNG